MILSPEVGSSMSLWPCLDGFTA